MGGGLCAAGGGGAGGTVGAGRGHDPWLRLLGRARHRLEKAGLSLPEAAPPRQIATQAMAHFGAAGQPVHDWLLRLEAQRYAKTPEAGLPALRAEFRKMAWPR